MAKAFDLDDLEISYLGHSSFKIKKDSFVIYLDPYNLKTGEEKADLILITHGHHDHHDEKSIELISDEKTQVLVGGEKIKESEERKIRDITIKAVPAYNLVKPFHPRGKGVGFIIEIEGKRIYHAGDTDKIFEMTELGKIDLALLPIGGVYTMNVQEAAEAVEIIKPKIVMPMHYNTFSEIKSDPEKFKKMVGRKTEVVILE